MNTTTKSRFRPLALLCGGALFLALSTSPSLTYAANPGDVLVPAASWCSGLGVDVHWQGTDSSICWGDSYVGSVFCGCEWQCGELAMRLYNTRGWYNGNFGVNVAADIYGHAGALGMTAHANGSGYIPVPGDMVIFTANCGGLGSAGHVALVDYIDSGHVYVCEQNWSATGRATYIRSGTGGSTLTRSDGVGCITGCVHSPNNPLSNSSNSHINPALGINSDGRMELFAVGHSGALYHSYQTTPNGSWSGWNSLGGTWVQNAQPVVLRNANGKLEVFIIGTNGALNHAWENTAGNSTSWTGFSTFSSLLTQTVKVGGGTNLNGALDIFVVGTDGALYEMHQTSPGGSWTTWTNFGGTWLQDVDIATGNDADGRQEVMLIGNTGNLYTKYQTSANGPWNSTFTSLGGSLSQTARTALGRNSDGRLEFFVIGTDGVAYHMYQTAANGGWSSWSSLGGSWETDAQPVVGADLNGALELLLIGHTGNMYHNYQTGGGWSGFISIGNTLTQNIRPVVGPNKDGRMEVFTTGSGSDMVTSFETAPNGTSWSTWTTLGGSWN